MNLNKTIKEKHDPVCKEDHEKMVRKSLDKISFRLFWIMVAVAIVPFLTKACLYIDANY